MIDGKKYMLYNPDTKERFEVDGNVLNERYEQFRAQFPKAQIFQVDSLGKDSEFEADTEYQIYNPDTKETISQKGSAITANKDAFFKAFPKAQITSYTNQTNSFQDQYEKKQADAIQSQLEDLNGSQVEGYTGKASDFMKDFEQARDSVKKDTSFGAMQRGQGPVLTPDMQFVQENSEKYHTLANQRQALQDQLWNTPYMQRRREAQSNYLHEKAQETGEEYLRSTGVSKEDPAWVRGLLVNETGSQGPMMSADTRLWKAANNNYNEAKKLIDAPYKRGDNTVLDEFVAAFQGSGDLLTSEEFWSPSNDLVEKMGIRPVLEKFQEKASLLSGVDMSDKQQQEWYDKTFTPAEKEVIESFLALQAAHMERADNIANGYQIGQTITQSAKFMADFLVFGDAAKAGAAATSKGVSRFMTRKAIQMLGGNNARALARWLGNSAVAKAVTSVASPVMESVLTAAYLTPMSSALPSAIADRMLAVNTEGTTDEEGNFIPGENYGKLDTSMGKAVVLGTADALVENWSEYSGELLEGALGWGAKKIAGSTPVKHITGSKAAQWFGKTKFGQFVKAVPETAAWKIGRQAGFNGFLGEMAEEFIGAAVSQFTGLDDEALKQLVEGDNLSNMAISFLPMTLLGLGGSVAQYTAAPKRVQKAEGRLRMAMEDAVNKDGQRIYSQKQIDAAINALRVASTAEEQNKIVSAITKQLTADSHTPAVVGAALRLANANMQYQALYAAQKNDTENRKRAEKQRIASEMGKDFWCTFKDEGGHEYEGVRTVVSRNGQVGYASTPDAEGNVLVNFGNGQVRKLSAEEVEAGTQAGTIKDSTLDDFLLAQTVKARETAETQRMATERGQKIKNVQTQIQKELEANATDDGSIINLGTEANPRMVLVTRDGVNAAGVTFTVLDENGKPIADKQTDGQKAPRMGHLSWEQIAASRGVDLRVKTDDEIAMEEADEILAQEDSRIGYGAEARAESDAMDAAEEANEFERDEDGNIVPVSTEEQETMLEKNPAKWARYTDAVTGSPREALSVLRAKSQKLFDMLQSIIESRENETDLKKREALRLDMNRVQAQYMATRDAYRAHMVKTRVAAWQKVFPGLKVNILTSLDQVKNPEAARQIKSQETHGWYEEDTQEVFIYAPHIDSEERLDKTIIHEAVTHKGLNSLFGEERYKELCEMVWSDIMTAEDRKQYANYAGTNGNHVAAADEFMAHCAEAYAGKIADEAGLNDKSVWEKIVDKIRSFFENLGLTFGNEEARTRARAEESMTWFERTLADSISQFKNAEYEEIQAALREQEQNLAQAQQAMQAAELADIENAVAEAQPAQIDETLAIRLQSGLETGEIDPADGALNYLTAAGVQDKKALSIAAYLDQLRPAVASGDRQVIDDAIKNLVLAKGDVRAAISTLDKAAFQNRKTNKDMANSLSNSANILKSVSNLDVIPAVDAQAIATATEQARQTRFSTVARAMGAGLNAVMADPDGNVAFIAPDGTAYTGLNPITVDALKSMPNTQLNFIMQDAIELSGLDEATVNELYQKYADMLNAELEKGLAANGGYENLSADWMWLGDTVFKTVSTNSDKQYSYSLDITRVCKKNEAVIRALSAAQKELGYGITPGQVMDIYLATEESGFQVPCPVCYVFSRYINNGKYATIAVNGMKKYETIDLTEVSGGKYGVVKGLVDPATMSEEEKQYRTQFWKEEIKRQTELNEKNKSLIAKAKRATADDLDDMDTAKKSQKIAKENLSKQISDLGKEILRSEQAKEAIKDLRERMRKGGMNIKELDQLRQRLAALQQVVLTDDMITLRRQKIEALDKRYRAALNVVAQAQLPSWIKQFVGQEKKDGTFEFYTAEQQGKLYETGTFPAEYALDLRRTGDTMREYPAIQRLRKSGGSAAGKEIHFEADNAFGDVISMLGQSDLKKATNWYQMAAQAETEEERQECLKKARQSFETAKLYAQRQSLRGGQRQWSWSDNIEKLAPDVFTNLMQLQMLGGALQSYSKQLEGISMVAKMGGYVNGSLMGRGLGYREVQADEIETIDGVRYLKGGDFTALVGDNNEPRVVKAPVIEVNGKFYTLEFDDVVGVDAFGKTDPDTGAHLKGLFELNLELDKAGNILVGMNDIHVKTAMADDRVYFIIPWHASGNSVHILQQMYRYLGVEFAMDKSEGAQDFTAVQEEKLAIGGKKAKAEGDEEGEKAPKFVDENGNEIIDPKLIEFWEAHKNEDDYRCGLGTIPSGNNGQLSDEQKEYKALRDAIFTDSTLDADEARMAKIMGDEFLSQVYNMVRSNVEGGKMTTTDTEFIYPYEYWNLGSTYETADENGARYLEYCRRLGYKPKFVGMLGAVGSKGDFGNFADDKGYWKLLIDRRMYDVNGNYQGLTPVDVHGFTPDQADPQITKHRFPVTTVANDAATQSIVDRMKQIETDRAGSVAQVDYDMDLQEAVSVFADANNDFKNVENAIKSRTTTQEKNATVSSDKAYEAGKKKIKFSTVWHGSSAEFDAFDHKFMGTGEGNQSYGWGTYVSEVKDVAVAYAEKQAEEGQRHLYQVEIPDDNGENYLHWDEPITRSQRKTIQQALAKLDEVKESYGEDALSEITSVFTPSTLGRHVESGINYFLGNLMDYATGKDRGAQRNAEFLRSLGFVGMQVPVNNTTNPSATDSNYVIYEAGDAKIENHTRFSITQEVKDEMERIEAEARFKGTYMKAPNGADTKLTEEQWKLVRTQNFLDWFGDWINDPANASKVVDENGEPMVVWHAGTFASGVAKSWNHNGEDTFTPEEDMHFGTLKAAQDRATDRLNMWFYPVWAKKAEDGKYYWSFNEIEDVLDEEDEELKQYVKLRDEQPGYATEEEAKQAGEAVESQLIPGYGEAREGINRGESSGALKSDMDFAFTPVFLSIRNPQKSADMGSDWNELNREENVDGVVYENEYEDPGSLSYIAFSPNQVKSATLNNGEYSKVNNDIRFSTISTEQDKAYRDAVLAGDMETAQKLVDEAAEAWAKDSKVRGTKHQQPHEGAPLRKMYHGTRNFGFNTFKTTGRGNNIGIHFGSERAANGFSYDQEYGAYGEKPGIYSVYLNLTNPFDTFDWFAQDDGYPAVVAEGVVAKMPEGEDKEKAKELVSQLAEFPGMEWLTGDPVVDSDGPEDSNYGAEQYLTNNEDEQAYYDIIRQIIELAGYDGIAYINDLEDNGYYDYIAFYPNQIKSAEAVTYDDQGQVISLSERFNTSKGDLRFSTVFNEAKVTQKQLARAYNETAAEKTGEARQTYLEMKSVRQLKGMAADLRDTKKRLDGYQKTVETYGPESAYGKNYTIAADNLRAAYNNVDLDELLKQINEEARNPRRTEAVEQYGVAIGERFRFDKFAEIFNANAVGVSPETRELFDKCSAVAQYMGITFTIDERRPEGNRAPMGYGINGEYGSGSNMSEITIDPVVYYARTPEEICHTMCHELIHGLTQMAVYGAEVDHPYLRAKMSSEAWNAAKEIINIYNQIAARPELRKLSGEPMYGATSPREMIAELANPKFREALKKISMWERIKAAIKRFVSNLIGISEDTIKTNAYEALSKQLDTLIDYFPMDAYTDVTRHGDYMRFIIDKNLGRIPRVSNASVESEEAAESNTHFSTVTDPKELEWLENQPVVEAYRAMQLIDGELYPPMSAYIDGVLREPTKKGTWERSEENPELADENGDFKLEKGRSDDSPKMKSLKAAYNPYFHTALNPLNDQFSEAQNRSNMVIVKVQIPQSELTSGYKAQNAKDAVGQIEWHKGPIAGVLGQYEGKGRQVMLSRWAKVVDIVPVSEIADVAEDLFKGTTLTENPLPTNVFTPALREELEKRGYQFVKTDNQGKMENGKTWASVYGKDGLGKKPKEKKAKKGETRFSTVDDIDNEILRNGFSALTLQRLTELVKSINNGTEEYKRIPRTAQGESPEDVGRNVEASIVARAGYHSSPRAKDASQYIQEQGNQSLRQQIVLEDWAKSRGIWYDNADDHFSKTHYTDDKLSGAESKIYVAPDRSHVVKVYEPFVAHSTPIEAIDDIMIHNLFFGPAIEITGVGKNKSGEFCFILEQQYIHEGGVVTPEEIEDYLSKADGLVRKDDRTFINERFIITDLHEGNIYKDVKGVLVCIDNSNQFNTVYAMRGGKYDLDDDYIPEEGLRFSTAYHGTKADFDHFDSTKMGTGEGAQAHGWGHYVALNKETSKGYAKRITEEYSYKLKQQAQEKAWKAIENHQSTVAWDMLDAIQTAAAGFDLTPYYARRIATALSRREYLGSARAVAKLVDIMWDNGTPEAITKIAQAAFDVWEAYKPVRDKLSMAYREAGSDWTAKYAGIEPEDPEIKKCLDYVTTAINTDSGSNGFSDKLYETCLGYIKNFHDDYKYADDATKAEYEAMWRGLEKLEKMPMRGMYFLDIKQKNYAEGNRHLYTVDIPDETGANYIYEDREMDPDALAYDWGVLEDLANGDMIEAQRDRFWKLMKELEEKYGTTAFDDVISPEDKAELDRLDKSISNLAKAQARAEKVQQNFNNSTDEFMARAKDYDGRDYYQMYARILGKERASKLLSAMGYAGIKYDGRRDGPCAVIFKDEDIKITEHIRFSTVTKKQDEEYAAAIKAGDTEKARQMVAEAARNAGYTFHAYHGTNNEFTWFDPEKLGSKNWLAPSAAMGFFAAGSLSTAQAYTGLNSMDSAALALNTEAQENMAKVKEDLNYAEEEAKHDLARQAFEEKYKAENGYKEDVDDMVAYALQVFKEQPSDWSRGHEEEYANNMRNTFEWIWRDKKVDGEDHVNRMNRLFAESEEGKAWEAFQEKVYRAWEQTEIKRLGYKPHVMDLYVKLENPLVYDFKGEGRDVEGFAARMAKAKEAGNDGCIFLNVEDGGEMDTIYTVFDNKQFKSADVATYDENGDLIPLSERFNPKERDTRFSTAYHGGAKSFDKFDLTKIGTGEGAQAHGWGLYFAFEEKTSRGYSMRTFQGRASRADQKRLEAVKSAQDDIDIHETRIQRRQWELDNLPEFEQWYQYHILDAQNKVKSTEEALQFNKDVAEGRTNPYGEKDKLMQEIAVRAAKANLEQMEANLLVARRNLDDVMNDKEGWKKSYDDIVEEKKDEIIARSALLEDAKEAYDKAMKAYNEKNESQRNLYQVELPEDNGSNYIDERQRPSVGILDNIGDEWAKWNSKVLNMPYRDIKDDARRIIGEQAKTGKTLLRFLEIQIGSDEGASRFLYKCGIEGIKYDGRMDGPCVVMFSDENIKITSHTRFSTVAQAEEELETVQNTKAYNPEDEASDTRFSISRRNEETIDKWLGANDQLDEKKIRAFKTYVKHEEPVAQLAMAKWFGNGSVLLPEDRPLVDEALKICRKDKLDPLSFKTPGEIVKDWRDRNVTEQEDENRELLSPDKYSDVLTNKREYEGGITVYDVEDSAAGQQAIRDLMNDHLATEEKPYYNCWCLEYCDAKGELTMQAKHYWGNYASVQRKAAFKDGKIVAFCASATGHDEWWDLSDRSHNTRIPVEGKIPGDRLGRSALCEFDPETGEMTPIGEPFTGNKKNGLYREWFKDGGLKTEYTSKGGNKVGVERSWFENGALRSMTNHDTGIGEGYNEDGTPLFESRYIGKDLLRTHWRDGHIEERSLMHNNEYIYEIYHPNGSIAAQYTRDHLGRYDGLVKHWDANGNLTNADEYVHGNKKGVEVIEDAYPNGQKYRITEVDGKMRKREQFSKDGHLANIYTWSQDGSNETVTVFGPDGSIRGIEYRVTGTNMGIKDMTRIEYNEAGVKTFEEIRTDRYGVRRVFSDEGKLINEAYYKDFFLYGPSRVIDINTGEESVVYFSRNRKVKNDPFKGKLPELVDLTPKVKDEWVMPERSEQPAIDPNEKPVTLFPGEKNTTPRFSTVSGPVATLDSKPFLDSVTNQGLEAMLGAKELGDAMVDAFHSLDDSAKDKIARAAMYNKRGITGALMDGIANMAWQSELSDDDKQLLSAVRDQIAAATGKDLSNAEALYAVALDANRGNDLFSKAARIELAHRLGFDQEMLQEREKVDSGIRFSVNKEWERMAASDMYDRAANYWKNRLKESWVDMYESVNDLVAAIEKESGMPAEAFEDIRLALNQQSSKGLAAMNSYQSRYLEPLWDAIGELERRMTKNGESGNHKELMDKIGRYVMLKHALERNEVFAKRDARRKYQKEHDEVVKPLEAKIKKLEKALAKETDLNAIDQMNQEIDDMQQQIDAADAHLQRELTMTENGTSAYYSEFRQNDYSGLTSMYSEYPGLLSRDAYKTDDEYNKAARKYRKAKYDNVADMEAAAADEVQAFEDQYYVEDLWSRINAATKETLKSQYEAGMMTRSQYLATRDMFEHYVPLRGFSDTVAQDVWAYYGQSHKGSYAPAFKGANGRTTESENPFLWIGTQASNAIAANVKNQAKQALYYFVMNRPGQNLATIGETWWVLDANESAKQGKKVFVPAEPPVLNGLDPDADRATYEQWEQDIIDLAKDGKAYKRTGKLDVDDDVIFIDPHQKGSHTINVSIGGKKQSIYINSSPRAAQAINGELNLDADQGYQKVLGPILRWMSSVNTSYNPEFWISNMQRDLGFALMGTMIQGKSASQFLGNYVNPARMMRLMKAYEEGTLGQMSGKDAKYADYYQEFADNGAITGYTVIAANDVWEKEIAKYLKKNNGNNNALKSLAGGLEGLKDSIMNLGEAVEQMTRFAAYVQARENGAAIPEAVNAAKEISVNFNRKGSGMAISAEEADQLRTKDGKPLSKTAKLAVMALSYIPAFGRRSIMFFNAAVQGLIKSKKLAQENPAAFATWCSAFVVLGVLNAVAHSMLAGDGDDDDYLNIPEYERRQNLMLGANGIYFKWALPQEVRMWYGMGDIIAHKLMGKTPYEQSGWEIFDSFNEILPIGIPVGTQGVVEAMPSVVRPFVEIMFTNKDYKGASIHLDNKWLSEEEKANIPNYNNAKKNTGAIYVELSKGMNFLSGGDKYNAGAVNIHPEDMQHITESLGGGLYRMFGRIFDTAAGAVSLTMEKTGLREEGTSENVLSVRRTPFLNKLVTLTSESYGDKQTNELFSYYKGKADHTQTTLSKMKKEGDVEGMTKLMESDDYKLVTIFKAYKKPLKLYNDAIKIETNRAKKKELQEQKDELERQMIKTISEF